MILLVSYALFSYIISKHFHWLGAHIYRYHIFIVIVSRTICTTIHNFRGPSLLDHLASGPRGARGERFLSQNGVWLVPCFRECLSELSVTYITVGMVPRDMLLWILYGVLLLSALGYFYAKCTILQRPTLVSLS